MYCFKFKSNLCPLDFIAILYLMSIFQYLKEVYIRILSIKKVM